jgi:hypothetical protein
MHVLAPTWLSDFMSLILFLNIHWYIQFYSVLCVNIRLLIMLISCSNQIRILIMLLTTQTTRLLGYQNFNFTKNAKKDDKLVYMVLFAYISWLDTYSHLSGYKLIQVHLRCSFRSLVYPQIHYKRQKCESVVLGSYIRPNP